jgi:arsenical pump membrane protein
MIPASFAHPVLIGIVAASIVLMLLRPRNIPEVYWVGSGAVLLVLLRLIPLRLAGSAVLEGSDVYLFLIGMMLLSELARENGVFDWLSAVAVKHAHGSAERLFFLIYAIGTAVTVTMSNDATAVVLTPAILVAVRRAKVDPLPYLFACAMIANAASFTLPISNPANLVVFHSAIPPLGRWLAQFLLPSAAAILVTFGVLRWYFRKELKNEISSDIEDVKLDSNGRIVLIGILSVVVVLLVTSALKRDLGLPTCVAALVFTAGACLKRRQSPLPLLREVSWRTLGLVAALFVLVDAMESTGALHVAESAFTRAQTLPSATGALLTAFVVGIGNNLINNLPLGLIAGSTLTAVHAHGVLANAVLIGVDLGPNLSVTGSLATILWLMAMRRENLNVSFFDFLKVGALAMPAALLVSIGVSLASYAFVGGR